MRLLERKAALDALAEFAAQAGSGEGRLVLVEGGAGVGKSALLEQFTGELPGSRLLSGACDGMFTPPPLGPLFDIAQQVGGRLHALGRAGASREELCGAFLAELSAPGPMPVVIIEDVHWGDEATLDLLGFLTRRIREAAVLLLVSYRDDELADRHPLRGRCGPCRAAGRRWSTCFTSRMVPLQPPGSAVVAAAGPPLRPAAVAAAAPSPVACRKRRRLRPGAADPVMPCACSRDSSELVMVAKCGRRRPREGERVVSISGRRMNTLRVKPRGGNSQ